MPLHLHHVLERYGCFLLIVMGEIALGISQYIPQASQGSEAAVYAQSFIVLWALLLFKLLYFDLAEVHIDDHAMRTSKYKGFTFSQIHMPLFGATALLGSCVDVLVSSAMTSPSPPEECAEDESTFDASGTSLICGSTMLVVVLVIQCLHRGVHTHRTVAEDLIHLECELISLEQEKQTEVAVDIDTFKALLRCLDDPADVKRIFGKEPGDKQLADVFNMFLSAGCATLGAAELQSLHKFLSDAAVIDKQRSLFATQSRVSKILRLLLSIFLVIMALLRTFRVSIGAASELYLIGDACFAVGVGVFSPFGTFALLASTFIAALGIDWVTATTLEHHAHIIEGATHSHAHSNQVAPLAHAAGAAAPDQPPRALAAAVAAFRGAAAQRRGSLKSSQVAQIASRRASLDPLKPLPLDATRRPSVSGHGVCLSMATTDPAAAIKAIFHVPVVERACDGMRQPLLGAVDERSD